MLSDVVMSTSETNIIKTQPTIFNVPPPLPQPVVPPLSLPPAIPLTPTSSTASPCYEEKLYKKQKQIAFEFDQIVKGRFTTSLIEIIRFVYYQHDRRVVRFDDDKLKSTSQD